MAGDELVGTWRKLAVNGYPLTDGYELLRLNADGTASIECCWDGEVFVVQHRWERVDDRRWRLDCLIPADALPGSAGDVVIPGPVQVVLELSATAVRMTTEFPDEIRAQAHRWMIQEGHLGASEPLPPDDICEYERVSEPGATPDLAM